MKTYVKTGEKIEIESYPYGRLRTKAYFSVEFSSKHGFRSVFQTVNPKNGRLNAPKKGTYAPMIVAYLDTETAHAEFAFFRMYNKEDAVAFFSFLAEHSDLFSDEQLEHLKLYALAQIKLKAHGLVRYCKVPVAEAIQIVEPLTKALVACIKEKTDIKAILSLVKPMYENAEKAQEVHDTEAA